MHRGVREAHPCQFSNRKICGGGREKEEGGWRDQAGEKERKHAHRDVERAKRRLESEREERQR